MGRLVGVVGAAERGWGEAVVGHLEQDAGGGGDAGEGAGEHADEGADVDERAEDGDVGERGEQVEGSAGGAEVLVELAEAEGLDVAPARKKRPERTADWMRARGMVRRGLRASWPRVVADSKPTKLKMARTTPRRTPEGVTLVRASWGVSMWGPLRKRRMARTMVIMETEAASIQSMRRVEVWTSR